MDHIKVEENKQYNFYTLTANEGYIITNTRNGFDVEDYTAAEKMVVPSSVNYEQFIAIPKEQHEKNQKLVDMYQQLKIDNPSIVV